VNKTDQYRGNAAGSRWQRWAEFVLRFRLPILAVATALTLGFAWQAFQLRSEWNENEELSDRDADVVRFREFDARFGGQEYLLVLLQAENVFTPEILNHLSDLTEQLRMVPNASDVMSLATVPCVRGSGAEARMMSFLSDLPETQGEADALRKEALDHPLWVGTLLSDDGRTACINVMLPSLSEDVNERMESASAAREILRRNPQPGVQWFVTGFSPLALDMQTALQFDLRRFLWLTPLLILGCLFLAFHTWRGVWVPAVVIVAAVVWTMGGLSALGGTLNIGTVLLPTLIAVNGLSYSIHFLNGYHESCARGTRHRKISIRTLVLLGPPLLMAAFTTAIGFGSLSLSELSSLRQLGIFSAVGVLIAAGLCIVLVPGLLSFLPLPSRKAHRHRSVRLLRRGLWRVAGWVNRDRWIIPAALVVLLVLSAVGISRIQVEAQLSLYLPESAPAIQGLQIVEENLSGFYVLEMELTGKPGTFHEPWALQEIEELQWQVAALDGVDQVVSVNDLFREVHQARMARSVPAGLSPLPETEGQIAEYGLLFSVSGHGKAIDSFLTSDGSAARVSARIRTMSTAGHLRLIEKVEQLAAQQLDSRLQLNTTGTLKLFAVRLHALVRSLFKSFGLSFLLIAVLMMIQLRSLRAGLCSMIPNVLPILMGFGLMGFLGIPLSASTVMIASVGIGIAVDDTIHLLMRYRRERSLGRTPESSVRRTLLGTGRAMVFSSLGLTVGFSILMFSQFRPNREFGMLIAFIMLIALLSDLFVTPFLVRAFRLFQKETR